MKMKREGEGCTLTEREMVKIMERKTITRMNTEMGLGTTEEPQTPDNDLWTMVFILLQCCALVLHHPAEHMWREVRRRLGCPWSLYEKLSAAILEICLIGQGEKSFLIYLLHLSKHKRSFD